MPRLARGQSLSIVVLGALGAPVVLGALAAPAAAQPAGNVTLDPFRPAIDSRGYLTVNASQVLGDRELSFGLGSLVGYLGAGPLFERVGARAMFSAAAAVALVGAGCAAAFARRDHRHRLRR